MVIDAKTCRKCNQWLPIGNFFVAVRNRDGYENICKPCKSKECAAINRRKIKPTTCANCSAVFIPDKTRNTYCSIVCREAKTKERRALWSKLHRERLQELQSNWRKKNAAKRKESYRKHRLKKAYGLTPDDYRQMVESQHNTCAVCHSSDPMTLHGRWCIDHCHATGQVRKLLCGLCNFMIGYAKDNPAILEAGAAYLRLFAYGAE